MKTNVSRPLMLTAGLTLVATVCLIPSARAEDDRSPVIKINEATAKADVQSEQLRGGLTMLSGAGGNIVVYDSPQGKFVVDSGIAVSKDKLVTALGAIGPSPLKYLVNTHYHWDHSDGNVWMHQAGATIIGAPMTVRHLSESTRVDDWNFTFAPVPPEGRPTIVVKGSKTMKFGSERIEMKNFGNGHTDSDLWVYFQKADVLVLGDIFWNAYYPFLDNEHGGGISNTIAWADKAIAATTDKTVIVPGHGKIGSRAELVAWRNVLVELRGAIGALKKQGKSLKETIAARPTARYDATFAGFVIDGAFFTKLVYEGQ